jgi:hypothetical protein
MVIVAISGWIFMTIRDLNAQTSTGLQERVEENAEDIKAVFSTVTDNKSEFDIFRATISTDLKYIILQQDKLLHLYNQ